MSENSEFKNSRVQDWDLVLGPIPFGLDDNDENDEFYKLAYKEAKRRYLISLANRKVKEDAANGLFDGKQFKVSEMTRQTQNSSRGRMITISLPHIDEENITSSVAFYNKKLNKMKFIVQGSKWVYEQRGDSEANKFTGIHIHLIMPRTKKYPNEISRDMSKQLNVANNFINIIDVRLEDADKYLLGEKKTTKKQLRQKFDQIMRSQFNIEQFYQK